MRIEQTRKLFSIGVLPTPQPTQDIAGLQERLEALRLVFAAEQLNELVSTSVKEDWNAREACLLETVLRKCGHRSTLSTFRTFNHWLRDSIS